MNVINALLYNSHQKETENLITTIHKCCSEINITSVVNSKHKLKKAINQSKTELVFISISDECDSFLEELIDFDTTATKVIVLSEQKDYAYNAFKFGVSSFVLRPINRKEFDSEVRRILTLLAEPRNRKNKDEVIQRLKSKFDQEKALGIPTMEGLEFIKVRHIIRCEGLQRCTKIVINDKKGLISSYNLGQFIRILEPMGFFSPHRSHLINLNYLAKYRKCGSILLADGSDIPISRKKKSCFMEKVLHL